MMEAEWISEEHSIALIWKMILDNLSNLQEDKRQLIETGQI